MFCGFPLGAAAGGFLAAWMIPIWGWRSVLLPGGITPLVLSVLTLFLLPESVRYLVAEGKSTERVRAALSRVSRAVVNARAFVLTEPRYVGAARSGAGVVLSRSCLVGSLMLGLPTSWAW